MIQISNLSKSYGTQVLFSDVTLAVNAGERIGLVGRNGSGKTTLLRLLTGEERPDSGSITFPQHYRVGYLTQQLALSAESVLAQACLGLAPCEDGADESYKAEEILMGLGFSPCDLSRSPFELSGGYQVRLHMAGLLVSEPDILLLDEPTNYLDILSIRWLEKFLTSWKKELMLVTHDRNFTDRVTTHTMGIHRAKIKKIEGTTHKFYQQMLDEEEIYEKTRVSEEKKRKDTEEFINRFRAQATRARAVQSRIKALEKKEKRERMSAAENLEFQFTPAAFSGKTLLEAQNVSFGHDAGSPLIKNLNIMMGKRERIAVVGKNGKGKTTLLNLLAGSLLPQTGKLFRHPALRLSHFGQGNIEQLDPEKTVEEEILSVLPEYSRNTARNICGIMMFEGDHALKKVKVLSGGEKSRVLLGRLIAGPANLLLLDEPTNHLDMESVDALVEAIDAFEGSVVIVSHSEMVLNAVAERLIIFEEDGACVFEGSYQDFLERRGWKEEVSPGRDQARKGNGSARRETKKQKADIINARSQTLTPLKARISEVEEEIIRMEGEMEEDTRALIEASTKGDGESIRQLSVAVHQAKSRIDALFDELAILSDDFNAKSKDFEERLESLSRPYPNG